MDYIVPRPTLPPCPTHRVQNWHVRKPLAHGRGGIVATQNRVAGEAGARVLAAGGNAVDAAVTTAFALAAVEPWNSGLGGVGFMLVYSAQEDRVRVVDFGPISPAGCKPADYPLVGGGTTTRDLFTWPSVKDDRNVHGPLSFAVPGQVDGMGLALERFGTMPFADGARARHRARRRGHRDRLVSHAQGRHQRPRARPLSHDARGLAAGRLSRRSPRPARRSSG